MFGVSSLSLYIYLYYIIFDPLLSINFNYNDQLLILFKLLFCFYLFISIPFSIFLIYVTYRIRCIQKCVNQKTGMNSRNKILFLGDSFVGKTSLINSLCGINVGQHPQSTLGCNIQIFAHQYQAGTPNETTELLEFWDVGGTSAHREASLVFMDNANGVILVYDKNNVRSGSEQNLMLWLDLLYTQTSRQNPNRLLSSPNLSMSDASSIVSEKNYDGSGERFIALNMERVYTIPILIVGTRLDQQQKCSSSSTRCSNLLRPFEHISLDARNLISPGSTNRLVFSTFFDQIVRHATDSSSRGGILSQPLGGIGGGTPRHRTNIIFPPND